MKNIQDIYSIAKEIDNVANSQELTAEVQNLTRSRTTNTAGQTVVPNINTIIDSIKRILLRIDTSHWTDEQWEIANILGVAKLLGFKGGQFLEEIKSNVLRNPANRTALVSPLSTELTLLRTKPKAILTTLKDFDIETNIQRISDEEGIIEITFEGKVEIEDFKEAKDQMNDWFLIIEGYARLLNVPRDDFEIINITKNSPTTFKLKTAVKNVSLVLGVVTSLLIIQRSYLDNQLLLERLRQTTLNPDAEEQRQFIETAENHVKAQIDAKIEALVNEKLEEHGVAANEGDVKATLTKGIENQYNFINNGGNINIYISNGELQPKVEQLQNTKEEIKKIKSTYEYQKTITSGDTIGQEKLDLDIEPNS